MIVYIGREEQLYWMEEVGKKRGLEVRHIPENLHIQRQINQILEKPSTYLIFDLIQYEDETEMLVDQFKKLESASHAKLIFFAGSSFFPESRLCKSLYEAGFLNFVFAWTVGDQKEELLQCFNGYMELHASKVFEHLEVEKLMEEETKEKMEGKRLIGVAGSLHRIGTTTQALQLVKYLQFHGKKACYIEMNDTGYVKALKEWFAVEKEEGFLGMIRVFGVDLYHKQNMLSEVLKENYQYYVYDYGTFNAPSFHRASYMEKELKFMVVGSGALEMGATTAILRSQFYKNIGYIYNLVPETEQKELLSLMEEKKDQTYFSHYAPDPFFLNGMELYQNILPLEEERKEKKKSWFFGKSRR